MTYDPVDSDADGIVEAGVDNQSVETEDATVSKSLTVGYSPLELGDGANANDSVVDTMAIGKNATASGEKTIAIGPGATGVSRESVVIGASAEVSDFGGLVAGYAAETTSADAVAVGQSASANRVAIGDSASSGNKGIAIGTNASASAFDTVAIGDGGVSVGESSLTRIGNDQLVFGGVRDTVGDASLNNSELTIELDESNSAFRLRGKDSGGTVREATINW